MMYPLKFEPLLKCVVWGGDKIAAYKGISTALRNIGESWELSGVEGRESVVANGEYAGRTISSLIREFKGNLIGEKVYRNTGEEFPVLVKFIDAHQNLSIQVHPDDRLAAERHNGSKGKTEMWYVIGGDEGAHLLSGLSQKISPEEYAERICRNTITEVLHEYQVKPGDVFFLPPGTIHSIGSGTFIAEIQQTSDISYRIYDYGRLGLDGKPRQLHIEESKAAVNFEVKEDCRTHYVRKANQENVLVDCRYFTTSLYDLDREMTIDLSTRDSFTIFICTKGSSMLTDSYGNEISLVQGETILIAADTPSVRISPSSEVEFLTCHIS